jgi:hypothetical protein
LKGVSCFEPRIVHDSYLYIIFFYLIRTESVSLVYNPPIAIPDRFSSQKYGTISLYMGGQVLLWLILTKSVGPISQVAKMDHNI